MRKEPRRRACRGSIGLCCNGVRPIRRNQTDRDLTLLAAMFGMGCQKPKISQSLGRVAHQTLAQGRGVLQCCQRFDQLTARYEGEYRAGKQNGRGVNTWANR